MGVAPEALVARTALQSLVPPPVSGGDHPRTVPGVTQPSTGTRPRSSLGDHDRARLGPGRTAAALAAGPFRWFQARTWRATAQLVAWFVMSWVFAVLDLAGLLASSVAGRIGERGATVRASALQLSAGTVRADLRRIEFFSGVLIQPLALVRAVPGATSRKSRQASEQAQWWWQLPVYELLSALVATALIAGAVAWWWGTIAGLIAATQAHDYWGSSIHLFGVTIGPSTLLDHQRIFGLLGGIIGVMAWPTAVRTAPAIDAAVSRALSRLLLGPTTSELSQEVVRVSQTRAHAVAAADAERRRIERDLHDGFQPQLVNLALNLGLARSRLATDPDSARALLDRAHEDAKRATADLRNLVRGIHPSVLDERGLDAAFSALAAGSGVPLQIDVHLNRRPARQAEGIAYFVVAEAITNVNKHAHARVATVTVTEIDGSLRVLVQDDGRGGAAPEPGGGLDGLAARIAGVDGTFSVTSPEGGPTWIEARIPCGW
jgi:signal transduction histidine kinase